MWTLKRGVEACRILDRIVQPFGFSAALYGGVLVAGRGNDLDVFLVPQTENADVKGAVEAVREGFNSGVDGPYLGQWNRLSCIVRLRPDHIDLQFTRLTAPPNQEVGTVYYEL